MSKYKDPEGGLTEAGRRKFESSGESENLQPGVKDKSPAGQALRRKGSFLTRFYTNPSGPLVDDKGKPTRLALGQGEFVGILVELLEFVLLGLGGDLPFQDLLWG